MGARLSKLRGRARQGELLERARQVSSWAPGAVALVEFKSNGVIA